jgi:hypothetical protein
MEIYNIKILYLQLWCFLRREQVFLWSTLNLSFNSSIIQHNQVQICLDKNGVWENSKWSSGSREPNSFSFLFWSYKNSNFNTYKIPNFVRALNFKLHGARPPSVRPLETRNGARAPWWLFFLKITKMASICFQKIETIFLDVHNVEIYEPAKFQFKIWCILGYRKKKDKTDKILSF